MGLFTKPEKKGAKLSEDGLYRHLLWREWDGVAKAPNKHWLSDDAGKLYSIPKTVLWIMLNPSTGDHMDDDPTIRRCIDFTKLWGYDRLEIVNLFSYRVSDPRELMQAALNCDVVKPLGYAEKAIEKASLIICAWGSRGDFMSRSATTRALLGKRVAYCFGYTKNGEPRHPLYVEKTTPLIRMK